MGLKVNQHSKQAWRQVFDEKPCENLSQAAITPSTSPINVPFDHADRCKPQKLKHTKFEISSTLIKPHIWLCFSFFLSLQESYSSLICPAEKLEIVNRQNKTFAIKTTNFMLWLLFLQPCNLFSVECGKCSNRITTQNVIMTVDQDHRQFLIFRPRLDPTSSTS